jgi:hypothetical protein
MRRATVEPFTAIVTSSSAAASGIGNLACVPERRREGWDGTRHHGYQSSSQ